MTPAFWLRQSGPDRDVAISTRARLARNLPDFPFPHRASQEERRLVAQQLRRAAKEPGLHHLEPVPLWTTDLRLIGELQERLRELVAAQQIPPQMTDFLPERWALLEREGSRSLTLLINEEDHLRLQAFGAGCDAEKVFLRAAEAESILQRGLTFALDSQLGYLTTSLANVGTGLRLSVLLHLPALRLLDQIDSLLGAVVELGGTVRGVQGERSENYGALYQVSHEATYRPELNPLIFVRSVAAAASVLIAAEREARQQLPTDLADQQVQARALINAAESHSVPVALELLSALRLYGIAQLAAPLPDASFAEAMVRFQRSEGKRAGYERANLLRRFQREEF